MLKATTNIMKKILAVSIAALFVISMMFFALPGKVYAQGDTEPKTYYVNATTGDDSNDGSEDNPYKTISQAINVASNGDTIIVAAGTYTEGITKIDKDLTIVGATTPISSITIEPAEDTGTTNDIGKSGRGWFQITQATVNFKNLVFNGSDKRIYTAVHYHGDNTGGSVENCDFMNIGHNPSGYQGRGIDNYGGYVKVRNCKFSNILRIGVFTYGNSASTLISGCTYTGKGDGGYLDYAFETGNGGSITVEGCTVTNCKGVASDGSTSAGILVTTYYGYGTKATITGNTLTNNSCGIAVGYDANDSSTVVAHYNNISKNTDYGICSSAPSVDATNNWWGAASGPKHETLNSKGEGNAVSDNVDFDPWYIDEAMTRLSNYVAPTPSAAQQAPTDYVKQTLEAGTVTVDASSVAGAYATVAGSGGQTVTIKQVPIDTALEQGFLVEGATKYVDLHLDSAQGIEKIEFTILGVSGIPKYWNGSSWIECSDYTIDAAGNVTVIITDTTIPSLADLTGTIFTVVPVPKTVRTHEMTCWQVYVNDNNNFEFVFLWEYKNNNWISIYDSQDNLVYKTSFPYGRPVVEVDLPDGTYTVKTFHEEGNILQEFTIAK